MSTPTSYAERALREKSTFAEKSVALVRLLVISGSMIAYLFGDGSHFNHDFIPPLIPIVWGYTLAVLFYEPLRIKLLRLTPFTTSILDALLCTIWIHASGGLYSEWWLLYFASLTAIAARNGRRATFVAAVIHATCYVLLILATHPMAIGLSGWTTLLTRVFFIFIVALLSGAVAHEHLMRSASSLILEEVVSERTTALAARARDLELSEQKLLAAKEAAESANRAKSDFLANVSHEIRTPLGVILGFTELLQKSGDDPALRATYLDTILRNSNQLLILVNDLLDLTKVEAGHIDVARSPFAVDDLVREMKDLLDPQAKAGGLHLIVTVHPAVPAVITSDHKLVRSIVANVVGNALKFTRKGSVHVELTSIQHEDGRYDLLVRVTDNGPGIATAAQHQLFTPFFQADMSVTRTFGGTGLGLALARRFSRALGGDVTLELSAPGQGATFLITLDGGPSEAQLPFTDPREKALVDEQRLRNFKILVVDEVVDNLVMLERMLRAEGAAPVTAGSALEGLKRAISEPFDAILLDIRMPDMDGMQALRELRQIGFRKPVVAVTAHALKDDRERFLALGFDLFVTKPLDRDALIEELRRTLSASSSSLPRGLSTPSAP